MSNPGNGSGTSSDTPDAGAPDTRGGGEPDMGGSAGNTTTTASITQQLKLVKRDDLAKFTTTHKLAVIGKGTKKERKYQDIDIRSLS